MFSIALYGEKMICLCTRVPQFDSLLSWISLQVSFFRPKPCFTMTGGGLFREIQLVSLIRMYSLTAVEIIN